MIGRLWRIPPALAALLAAGAVVATAWALLLPPLQGPDESAHIAATTRLVEDGSFIGGRAGISRELLVLAEEGTLGPLVGNVGARPAWTARDERRVRAALDALGDSRSDPLEPEVGPPTRGVQRNPPLYQLWEAVPYTAARSASLIDRLALMRLWNVPLLLITIAACWLLAAEVLPTRPLARVVAGGLAALQPQLVFLTGVINPDSLLVACFSVFCLAVARLLRRGLSAPGALLVLVAAAAGAATHARGVVLVPCAALALLLALPWGRMTPARRRRVAAGIAVAGLAVLAAYAIVSRQVGTSLTGAPAIDTGRGYSLAEFASYVWQFYLPGLPFMEEPLGGDAYGVRQVFVETAWGAFASLEVTYPPWVYDVVAAGLVLALGGALAALAGRRVRPVAAGRLGIVLGALVLGTLAVLHVSAYRLLIVDPKDPIIVGRHLLVLLAPLSLLVAIAVTALRRRAAELVTAGLLGGLATMQLAALGLTAARFYA